ncbi:MAG: DNA alkylation repair protein [Eubacteriales bacterium]|nr:DNA alkylation repair protein [Eubacteriales bacterium]
MNEIQRWLFAQQDLKYRDFMAALTPTLPKEYFIGVRTPMLRAYAKELIRSGQCSKITKAVLPHNYFEEQQLHAFILSEGRDYETVLSEVAHVLPFINNWATCDQLRPKIFRKYTDRLITSVEQWLHSDQIYTIRFGIGMLLSYYLDDHFKTEYLHQVAAIVSEEYYVNMMAAWYFATALAKQYNAVIPLFEEHRLNVRVHNKAIQKARESRQIPEDVKEYLKILKR